MSVLVTTASSIKSLVITRSLSKRGIEVINTDSGRLSPTFYSRYSKKSFLSPSPKKSPLDFLNTILHQVKKEKIGVLFPVNITETLLITKYIDKFNPSVKVPFDSFSKMEKLHNKSEFGRFASELGVPAPETYFVEDIQSIRKVAKKINYPVVIKLQDTSSSKGMSYAYSDEEFITKYKQTIIRYKLEPSKYPIVQEYIPGTGYGVSLLFNHGDPRAIFVHKRLREYPITGGPSTFRESVRHPKMEKIALDMLKSIEWHGLAMVEFKLDNRTNKPFILEVNPRFWGSINQAVVAGVDFPHLLYKMATDGDVEKVFNYKLGVRTRFLINDFLPLFSRLKISENRLHILKEFLKFRDKNLYYDDISTDDILPAIIFIYIGVKELVKKK